jgi:hypothetical protein
VTSLDTNPLLMFLALFRIAYFLEIWISVRLTKKWREIEIFSTVACCLLPQPGSHSKKHSTVDEGFVAEFVKLLIDYHQQTNHTE